MKSTSRVQEKSGLQPQGPRRSAAGQRASSAAAAGDDTNDPLAGLVAAFQRIDVNGDGVLSRIEVIKAGIKSIPGLGETQGRLKDWQALVKRVTLTCKQ